MNKTEAKLIAQDIINTNIYLTLGTTDGKKSWVSPLFYCKDKKNRFYVISQPHSKHIKNISSKAHVSFAIFDSHAIEAKALEFRRRQDVNVLTRFDECTQVLSHRFYPLYQRSIYPRTIQNV
jgi:uncharacterized protein YhbP (UPF0306 family)